MTPVVLVMPGFESGLFEIRHTPGSVTVTCLCCHQSTVFVPVAGGMDYQPIAHDDACPALAFVRAAEAGQKKRAHRWLRRAQAMTGGAQAAPSPSSPTFAAPASSATRPGARQDGLCCICGAVQDARARE